MLPNLLRESTRNRLYGLVTWGALLAVVGACEKPPAVNIPPAPRVEQLVVVTPHNEIIRGAFEDAFSDWHHEKYESYVQVRWVAPEGTPQCVQLVKDATRPDFVATGQPLPDVLFGGGPLEHQTLAERGLSRAVKLADVEAELPATVMGVATRDAQDHWHSSALSSYGILVARQACRQRGIAEPVSWADLADPRFYGWLAIADPERSGSNRQCFLVVLQKYGWEQGWGLIMRMAANCRALASGSAEVINNVVTGNCLAGFSVDFSALRRMEATSGDRLAYVRPSDACALTPDALSVLTYGLNAEVAERFARFCVSEAGQKVWGFRAEFRGGRNDTLFHFPLHPKFYAEYKDKLAVSDNPFEMPSALVMDPVLEKKRADIVGPLLLAACGENHVWLQRCWQKVIAAGLPPAAMTELFKPILSEAEAYEAGTRYQEDGETAKTLQKDWSDQFRQRYERVEALLVGS